jgi:hypothetical protein
MSVNFRKKPHILVIHGVQLGDNDDIQSAKQVENLVKRSLKKKHIDRDFFVNDYLYEDMNDNAQTTYKLIGKAITTGRPISKKILKSSIDVLGDVITAAKNTSTAANIRKGLKEKILESYHSGNQLVIIAHSLGTVYALDVISELMNDTDYFNGDDNRTWPVQGYISMGSPLGLDIAIPGATIFEKRNIASLAAANYRLFPWHNYYNRLDPVVSGHVFGNPIGIRGSKGPVEIRYGADMQQANWLLQGHTVTSGKQWLLAHLTYWNNSKIGDKLTDMIWG